MVLPLKSGVPIRISLKPSLLKSPAELTANPGLAAAGRPGEDRAGDGVGAGRADSAQVDVPHAVGGRGEAGQIRAAVDEIGGAGASAALRERRSGGRRRSSAGRDAVDVAGVGTEKPAWSPESTPARITLCVPLWPRVETSIGLGPSPRAERVDTT